jgi:hypothetical protein
MPPSSGCEIGQLKAKAKATYTMSSSTQDLPTPNLDLGNTFGALFIGVTLAAVLVNLLLAMHCQSKLNGFCHPIVSYGTASLA